MKLHLPKKLRAALLAVVSMAVTAPATAQLKNTAVYDTTYFQHATQVHANHRHNVNTYDDPNAEEPGDTKSDNFNFHDPTSTNPKEMFFNARENDWVLTIDAYNVGPTVDGNKYGIGSMIFGTTGITLHNGRPTDTGKEYYTLNAAESFAVALDLDGNVRLMTSDKEHNRGLEHNVKLFNIEQAWDVEEVGDEVVSFRLTLSWDADGGMYNIDGERYGALTLQSAYLLSNDEGHAVVKELASHNTGHVVLNNYKMQENLLSVEDDTDDEKGEGGAFALVSKGATVSASLQTPGNSPAWCIYGNTSIKYLLNGQYVDNTIGAKRTMAENERVKFLGNNSVIWLTEGEYTYKNPTWASPDPEGKTATVGVGFGAYAGATLTVDESVLNSTVIGAGAMMSALGDGTVRLEVNTGAIESVDLPTVIEPIDPDKEKEDEEEEEDFQPEDDTLTGDDSLTGDDITTGDDSLTGDDTTTGDDSLTGDDTSTGDDSLTGDDTTTGDDSLTGDDTTTGDDSLTEDDTTTDGETGGNDAPSFTIQPDIAAGDRTIIFTQLGAKTNVELDVMGSGDVTVMLGSATIGNGDASNTTRITRLKQITEDGTPIGGRRDRQMNVVLYSGTDLRETSYVGVLENKEGNLHIKGREYIYETDEKDNIISVEYVYSRLSAQELLSTGEITVNGIVKVADQVKAGTYVYVDSGYLETKNLYAPRQLQVGLSAVATDLPYEVIDLDDVTLKVSGKAEVGISAEVYGQAYFGELTVPRAEVFNTDNIDAVLEANTLYGDYVARMLTVTETLTEEDGTLEGEDGTLTGEGGTPAGEDGALTEEGEVETEIEINQDIIISRPTTADSETEVAPLFSDGVYIGKDGILAGTIAEGTLIQISADCGAGVAANTIKGSDLQIGDTVIMTNMSNEGGVVQIDPNAGEGVIASLGTLKADVLNLPEGYALSAAKLIVTDENPEMEGAVLSENLTTTGYTEFKNLAMKGAEIAFESLETDKLVVDDESTVVAGAISTTEGAEFGDSISLVGAMVKGDLTIGKNASLSNLTTKGVLSVGENASLTNSIIQNTFKNQGTTALNNVSLGKISFGGAEGAAFSSTGNYNSLIISGTLTDSALKVSDLVLDAMNLEFGEGETKTYTLLTAADGSAITLGSVDDFVIYVQSYTYADIEMAADGSVVITGTHSEETAKNELLDTETRANTMAALEYAKEMASDKAIETLHGTLGDVMHTSLEKRQELLDAISGASLTALADSQRRGIQDVQSSLRNRIIQMGGVRTDESMGVQAWGQADGSFTSSDSGDDGPGYDYNTWGATVGANVDVCESVVVGMSFSASYGELDVDSADSATGNNDAYYVNFFARHQSERWVQMLILTAGMNDMDLERTVGPYNAEGTTSGTSFSAYYELGYTFGLDEEFTHILQPIVSASITSAKVDGYAETGSIGNAALEYDGASLTYGTVGIGLRYQGELYRSIFNRSAVLELRAQLTQDFGDATNEAEVSMAGGALNTVCGTDTSGTGYTLGAGLSIPVQMQTTVFADVDMTMRPDYTGFRANVGMRYDF